MGRQVLMTAVLAWRALCASAAPGEVSGPLPANQMEAKNQIARVVVSVQSNIYTYELTNLGKSPIVSFQVAQHAAYNFKAPDAWQIAVSRDLFKAVADNTDRGIQPGETGEFSMRVSSKGAVLGRGVVGLTLSSGESSAMADIWAPTAEPASHIALTAVVIVAIAAGHSIIVALRGRRAGRPTVSV